MLAAIMALAVALAAVLVYALRLRRLVGIIEDERPQLHSTLCELALLLAAIEALDSGDQDEVFRALDFRLMGIAKDLPELFSSHNVRDAIWESLDRAIRKRRPLVLLKRFQEYIRSHDSCVHPHDIAALLERVRAYEAA